MDTVKHNNKTNVGHKKTQRDEKHAMKLHSFSHNYFLMLYPVAGLCGSRGESKLNCTVGA